MESHKQLMLILSTAILILISATMGATTGPPITCHVAVFQNSRSASLGCRYNKDLRDKRENYDITFCPSNSRCLDAISCNWDGTGLVLDCVTAPDFQGATCTLSGEQTGDLVCLLPNVRPHHSGSYTCHLVPPDGRVQQSCAVVVPSEDKKDEDKAESAHVWVLTAVVIALVIAAFIVFVIWVKRRIKKRRGYDKGKTQEDGPEASAGSPTKPQAQNATTLPDNQPEDSSRSGDQIKTPDRTDQHATDNRQRQDSPVLPGSTTKYVFIADKEEVKNMLADANRSMKSDQGLPGSQHEMHSGAFSSESPTLPKKVSENDREKMNMLITGQRQSDQKFPSSTPVKKAPLNTTEWTQWQYSDPSGGLLHDDDLTLTTLPVAGQWQDAPAYSCGRGDGEKSVACL